MLKPPVGPVRKEQITASVSDLKIIIGSLWKSHGFHNRHNGSAVNDERAAFLLRTAGKRVKRRESPRAEFAPAFTARKGQLSAGIDPGLLILAAV